MDIINEIGATIQVLLSCCALVGALYSGWNQFKTLKKSPTNTRIKPIKNVLEKVQNTFNLAFVLLLSCIFSLLLINAILISGRNFTSWSLLESTGSILLLSIIVSASSLLLWYFEKTQIGIFFWSSLTLLLTTIGPGGPLSFGNKEYSGLIDMWLPIGVLSYLMITSYMYGRPFKENLKEEKKAGHILIISIILLFSTVSMGGRLLQNVENDVKNPNISSDRIKSIIKKVSFDKDSLEGIYSIFSEINLLEKIYEDNYNIFANEKGSEIDIERIERKLKRDGYDRGSKIWQKELNHHIKSYETYRELGKQRIDQIFDFFKYDLELENQLNYLAERLSWIYATGEKKSIDLPGISGIDRFSEIAKNRTYFALVDQKNIRKTLLEEFNYDESVVESINFFFGNKKIAYYNMPLLEVKQIFKKNFEGRYHTRLLEQLCLPYQNEAFLAFRQYTLVSQNLIKNFILNAPNNKIQENQIDSIYRDIDNLSTSERNALIFYLADHKDVVKSENNYNAFESLGSSLSDKGIKLLVSIKGTDEIRKLGRILESKKKVGKDTVYNLITSPISKLDEQEVIDIRELFNSQDPKVRIQNLLSTKVFKIINALKKSFSKDQKKMIIKAIGDPISITAKYIIDRKIINSLSSYNSLIINDFIKLKQKERENLLHYFAISLYKVGGHHSLGTFKFIISQASSNSRILGFTCASIFSLPFTILLIFFGFFSARSLISRDKIRSIILKEDYSSDKAVGDINIGLTTSYLHGRTHIKNLLKILSGRGWSSIALVGRRGIGKTRVLYDLFSNRLKKKKSTISAWITTPSKFNEEDFIESVLERILISTENSIAQKFKAKSIEARRLDLKAFSTNIFIYIILLFSFLLMFSCVPADSHILNIWFPLFIMFMCSIICLGIYFTKIQPINLTYWLERDRNINPHTILLYREIKRVQSFLKNRHLSKNQKTIINNSLTWILYTFLTLLLILIVIPFIIDVHRVIYFNEVVPVITSLVLFISALTYFVFNKGKKNQESIYEGKSLISLINEYRSFMKKLVERLDSNALGKIPHNDFQVAIYIDELDKIVKTDDLKEFLSKMKIIFEIPGVYYYLSISEDALNNLYLGAAKEKNEIDSAFDHIVYLPPLECNKGENLAKEYLIPFIKDKKIGDRLYRLIATISFGIPRDIIRRCDEFLAYQDNISIPQDLANKYMNIQADIAYTGKYISSKERNLINYNAKETAINIKKLLNEDFIKKSTSKSRIFIAIWGVALISWSCSSDDDTIWKNNTIKLSALGYKVVDEVIDDLLLEINKIHNKLLNLNT